LAAQLAARRLSNLFDPVPQIHLKPSGKEIINENYVNVWDFNKACVMMPLP
jgi:hypothetical protein